MIVVIVIDLIDVVDESKGFFLKSVQRIHQLLSSAGHEVRLVSCGSQVGEYSVPKRWIPVYTHLAKSQGLAYGKADEDVLKNACQGAHLMHIMLPFKLGQHAEFVARNMEVPVLASFGLTGHQYLRLAGLGWCKKLVGPAYTALRSDFYFKFKHILCHTETIYKDLKNNNYDQVLHVMEEQQSDSDVLELLESTYSKTIAHDQILYADESRQIFRRNWAVFPSSIDIEQPYKKNNLFFHCWYSVIYGLVVSVTAIFNFIVNGLRVEGHENLPRIKQGAITVSNHIHNFDSAMIAAALAPNHITFTSIEGNFKLPFVRWILKWAGVVPIPTSTHVLRSFFVKTVEHLKLGRKIHFFPEGSLWQYYTGLRPFKKGAFHMAVDANVPIIPVTVVQRPVKGIRKLFQKKALFTISILEPVYANPELSGSKQIIDLRDRVHAKMNEVLEKSMS